LVFGCLTWRLRVIVGWSQAAFSEGVATKVALGMPRRTLRTRPWMAGESRVIFQTWKSAARFEIRDVGRATRWRWTA
jgi:hypothetical protein